MASLDRRFALCRLDEAQRRLDFGLKMPELQMEADYDLKGHVLLLPIVGNGRASLKISESALFHLANDIPQLIARLLNTTFRIYCLNGTGPLKCFVTFPVSVFQWRLLLQRTRRRRCRRGSCWTRWKEKRWWRSSPWRWTLTSAPWTCSSTTSSTGTKSSVSPGPLLSWAELSRVTWRRWLAVAGHTLNAFLNKNAEEVVADLKEPLGESLSQLFIGLINQIFLNVPLGVWLPRHWSLTII